MHKSFHTYFHLSCYLLVSFESKSSILTLHFQCRMFTISVTQCLMSLFPLCYSRWFFRIHCFVLIDFFLRFFWQNATEQSLQVVSERFINSNDCWRIHNKVPQHSSGTSKQNKLDFTDCRQVISHFILAKTKFVNYCIVIRCSCNDEWWPNLIYNMYPLGHKYLHTNDSIKFYFPVERQTDQRKKKYERFSNSK